MKAPALVLGLLAAAGPLAAQSFTGEFRALGVGAYAPSAGRAYAPGGNNMAGVMGDLSFITGRFRLGPEGSVLRGSKRRVWSLGAVARYELRPSRVRPYGLVAAGMYFWDAQGVIDVPPTPPFTSWGSDVNPFSMSVGGGVTIGTPGGRTAATAELRFHHNLKRLPRSLVSVGLGGRIAW